MTEAAVEKITDFIRKDFAPRYGERRDEFSESPVWDSLRNLGTELWLDTGNLKSASELWTKEFSALTTNNTLLYQEVRHGTYDTLIGDAHRLLAPFKPSKAEEILEIGFIVNARHALTLVEQFDAFVSVEEHTDLARNAEMATSYGRRYHEVCPERFIVKIPFTSSGLVAARRLAELNVPVNLTLGFSARQNYIASRLARPRFVNVFLGRLNAVTAENDLGSGEYVGEKTTIASQKAVRYLREQIGIPTRQIGASLRDAKQVVDLAGLDVLTMPPTVADSYRKLAPDGSGIRDRTGEDYTPGVDAHAAEELRFDTLWTVEDELIRTVMDVEARMEASALSADELEGALAEGGFADIFPCWSKDQLQVSMQDGKIPNLKNWESYLRDGLVGIDSLLNLAGLLSFTADQTAMDQRIRGVLKQVR